MPKLAPILVPGRKGKQMKNRSPLFKNDAGFTLVEMALLVLVLGLFIGSTISFMNADRDQEGLSVTKARQNIVAAALANYAEKRGFLPCPGAPDAATLGDVRAACATDALRNGIVPFRELGLSREDVIDGYGNPFTYAISDRVRNGGLQTTAEYKCRVPAVWVDAGVSYNPQKALFCCQLVADNNALFVDNGSGVSVITTQGASGNTAGSYNVPSNDTGGPSAGTQTYMAYVLVSHGKNGWGSYILGSATKRSTSSSANEAENSDEDRTFVTRSIDLSPSNMFDDIVIWRTQEQMMLETGGSCTLP